MGRKDTIPSFPIFGASGVSMTGNQTSAITAVAFMDNIGILATWTGTAPVGTLAIYGSADPLTGAGGTAFVPTNWSQITTSPTPIAVSGASGTANISINQFPFNWIKVAYVFSSGTGTLFANLTAKQIGG